MLSSYMIKCGFHSHSSCHNSLFIGGINWNNVLISYGTKHISFWFGYQELRIIRLATVIN